MEKQQQDMILNQAIDFFGAESQKIMAIEEMSELIKELTKELRNRGNVENIADELADVEIMLAQLKIMYKIHDLVIEHKDFKLNRLATSIEKLKQERK